jgi:protein TonB
MLIASCLLAAVLPAAPAPPQSLPGRLAGTVVDFLSRPIAGVEITAVPTGRARPVHAISDANGRFTLELPPGDYAVFFRADGYGPARREIAAMSNAEFPLTVPLFRLVRVNPPVVMPPQKLAGALPLYPEPARQLWLRHLVILDLIIGHEGTVTDVKVVRGHPLLNQAAIDAVARWRYTPTVLDGEPVDVQLTVTVSFPPRVPPTTVGTVPSTGC